MHDASILTPAAGYFVSGACFFGLSAYVIAGSRNTVDSYLLAVCLLASAVCSVVLAVVGSGSFEASLTTFIAELGKAGFWLLFLAVLMRGGMWARQRTAVRYIGPVVAAAIFVVGIAFETGWRLQLLPYGSEKILVAGSVMTSITVLFLIEQILRNARGIEARNLKLLCVGIALIFLYDLFLYSNALINAAVNQQLWGARGFAVLPALPLILLGSRRVDGRQIGFFVSRKMILYSATLVAAGAFLTIALFGGFYVRDIGGRWGEVAQIVLGTATVVWLSVLLLSDSFRVKFRRFVVKYFFDSKYDFRAEWLRLIETLSLPDEELPLQKRAIKALAQVISSNRGQLWMRREDSGDYECAAAWNTGRDSCSLRHDEALATFVSASNCVVDLVEQRKKPRRYPGLSSTPGVYPFERDAIIVPLHQKGASFGFVALSRPEEMNFLSFEEADLLKTAGLQVTSYLLQEQATELLAQSRQFEAFNKLTAFLMHDLKNLVAQQALLVSNAKKFKGEPEFVDDAIATIEHSVSRMNRLLGQLSRRVPAQHPTRVSVPEILTAVAESARERVPNVIINDVGLSQVLVDRDSFFSVLMHLVTNAQEASEPQDSIVLSAAAEKNAVVVTVSDTGAGMNADFIQNRLFRPFDSTKGASGMGIGAYQAREFAVSNGGSLSVESTPGCGTTVTLQLPQEVG